MNKYAQTLLTCLGVLAMATGFSQCDIDYDFGDAEFGVSPTPLSASLSSMACWTNLISMCFTF